MYLPHWPIPSTLGGKAIDYESVFERMSLVLEKLGNPHKKLPPIVHVTGTNGKGSTVAVIAKIFSCAGYKTHIYTSPHLHDCNERIVLNGEKISDNELYQTMEEVRLVADSVPLTFMEAFTIGAFLAFSKNAADVLIMEVGMGGRIDATNIVEEKLATVITPISFDHTEYLGNSVERIALEKSMIVRPNAPMIVASQPKQAKEIIKIICTDQKVFTYFYDENFSISYDQESGEFDLIFEDQSYENLSKPALVGDHQYINFATAIATILAIQKEGRFLAIKRNHIEQAIKTVTWQSRLEKISGKILNNSLSELWIDGAHNEAGAFALARWIANQQKQNSKIKHNIIICGFSRNKCKARFLEKFFNVADEIIGVRVNGEPYPESAETIKEIGLTAQQTSNANCKISSQDALSEAIYYISQNYSEPCRIIICGSLHLARDVELI